MNVADAIRTKRAVRQFETRPVPDEAVQAVLNAGRRAQSSKNTQPWEFIVVRERERLEELATCGTYAAHVAGSAFTVVLAAPSAAAAFDLGQAAAYMQLAAWELGIGSCLVYFHDEDCARRLLGVPAGRDCHMALDFGYPAPDQQRPSVVQGGRKSLQELVHWERW